MSLLFQSANFVGFLGLSLIIWVGIRLILSGHRGGWLLSLGAAAVTFSFICRLFLAPLINEPLHLSFSYNQIAAVTALPAILLSIGFLLIPLGLFVVAARQEKEIRRSEVRSTRIY